MTTTERVLKVANDVIGLGTADDLSADTTILDLELDSLDLYELILELEDEFDVEIDDGEVEDWLVCGDIVACINSKLA